MGYLNLDPLGAFHLLSALASMLIGGIIVLQRKGSELHKWLGRSYAVSMLTVNVTALLIYDLFGGFGPFHVAAIVGLVTMTAGIIPAWLRRPGKGGWMHLHAHFMSWSYVGLMAAAVSEISTRVLKMNFGMTVIAATITVTVIGAIIIYSRVPKLLPAQK